MRREISVSLYGEVQKEVIQATLADDFGIDVAFRETTTICVERPAGSGDALEILHAKTKSNPYLATTRPADRPRFSDVRARVPPRRRARLERRSTSTRSLDRSRRRGRYVRDALQRGALGWQVVDCAVT